MPKARIDDVAKLAGVSVKTVSRVFNREPNVRESTRQKVEEAISQLHYRPSLSARNLASREARLICLVYDDPSAYEIPSSGYVMRMQQGCLRACKPANIELLIHPSNYRDRDLATDLQTLIQVARPIGIILAAPLSNMPKIVRALDATKTPMVRLSPGGRSTKQCSVCTNDRDISAEMTRYLASLGHQKIAFIKGNPRHRAVGNRFLGYCDALQQLGLTLTEQLVATGDNSFESGEACGVDLLARRPAPTAIFAANDDMAAGVLRAAARLRIDVPGGVSVAGWDDIPLARQLYPALTTIRQPLCEMAERAALTLINERYKESPRGGMELIPASLKIRESTGQAP